MGTPGNDCRKNTSCWSFSSVLFCIFLLTSLWIGLAITRVERCRTTISLVIHPQPPAPLCLDAITFVYGSPFLLLVHHPQLRCLQDAPSPWEPPPESPAGRPTSSSATSALARSPDLSPSNSGVAFARTETDARSEATSEGAGTQRDVARIEFGIWDDLVWLSDYVLKRYYIETYRNQAVLVRMEDFPAIPVLYQRIATGIWWARRSWIVSVEVCNR